MGELPPKSPGLRRFPLQVVRKIAKYRTKITHNLETIAFFKARPATILN
jgi:hypothetical protein